MHLPLFISYLQYLFYSRVGKLPVFWSTKRLQQAAPSASGRRFHLLKSSVHLDYHGYRLQSSDSALSSAETFRNPVWISCSCVTLSQILCEVLISIYGVPWYCTISCWNLRDIQYIEATEQGKYHLSLSLSLSLYSSVKLTNFLCEFVGLASGFVVV